MPQPRETSFTAYIFTSEEMNEAVKLNTLQEMYMKSLRTDTAEILLSLKFDGKDALVFAQQEAYTRGQLELLEYLLAQDSSIKLKEETERRLREREQEDIQQTQSGA